MRRSTLMWAVLGIAVVIGLFVVKHRVQALEERLQTLNTEIIANQDAVQVLEAEWSYLNQPARLEALGRRLLGMTPPEVDQTRSIPEFLRRGDLDEAAPEASPDRGPGTEIAVKPPPRAADPGHPEDWLAPILARLKRAQ